MLSIILEKILQTSLLSSVEKQEFQDVDKDNFYKLILNESKKYFLSKKIQSDNISIQEEKNRDKNVCNYFLINNLINIFTKKRIFLNTQENDVKISHKVKKK